jgi:hypothetical protein
MAAQCNQRRFEFHGVFRRHVVAKFDRGAVAAAISEVLRGNPPE